MVHRASVVEETELTYVKSAIRGVMVTLGKKLMGDRLGREGDTFRPQLRKQMQARRKRLLGEEGGAGSRADGRSLR